MRIGELAAAAGVDVETIRYYERERLLDAPPRQPNGYRSYNERHRQQLVFIRHCRSLDVGLSDVRALLELLDDPQRSCATADHLIDTQIERIRSNVAALHALETQLVSLRAMCTSQRSGASCRILAELAKAS
jgi:Cd(II)/Pb(II)-responsive transcriptional regulator